MTLVSDTTYYFNTQTGNVHQDVEKPDIYNLTLCRGLYFIETNSSQITSSDIIMTSALNTAFKTGFIKYIAPESFHITDNKGNIFNFIKSLSLIYHDTNAITLGGIEIYQKTDWSFHIVVSSRSFSVTVDTTKEKIISSIKEILETSDITIKILLDIYDYLKNSDILDTYFDNLSGYSDSYFN